MHDHIKEAAGIELANCATCSDLGSESDGNWPEMAVSWSVCRKKPHMTNLKGFPFKSEMKCWSPEFWHSKYAERIETGETEEIIELIRQFMEAISANNVMQPTPDTPGGASCGPLAGAADDGR